MRILQCHKFHFITGGAERYLFDLCEGLTALGHSVANFSTKDRRNFSSDYSEYFVRGIDFSQDLNNNPFFNIKPAFNAIYSLEAKRNIERLINAFRPDIVHIHNIYHHLSTSILHTLHRHKIPIIMTLHDYKLICPNYTLFTGNGICERCRSGNYYNVIIHKCLKGSSLASGLACLEMYFSRLLKMYEDNIDLFIAPSRFIKEKMTDFGCNPRKIFYLPHAVNLDDFCPNFDRGKYILYFGKLSPEKGVKTLLKSARYLPTIPIKIIGDGLHKKELESFVRKNKLSNIDFLGHRPKNELIDFIRNALFVVVPSLWYEVSGLVIYEAFAAGKCVLASRIGGIPELIDDGINGILFPPGDDKDLAGKMQYLLNNPQRTEDLGKNAFEKIQKFNNRALHYQGLLNLYDKIINEYK